MKTTCPKCNGVAETSLKDDAVKDNMAFMFMCRCGHSFEAILYVANLSPERQNFTQQNQGLEASHYPQVCR